MSRKTVMVFIYIYRININIERLIPLSNKHNLHLKNIVYFADFLNFSPINKVWKIVVASKHPAQSAIKTYVYVDAIN